MTRRESFGPMLAAGLAGQAGAAKTKMKLIKPNALRPGDVAGVISPATQVTDPDKLESAQRTIDFFGLKAKWGRGVKTHHAQGIASVAERVDDLHDMFRDPEVKAVFCIRGGYGAGQILADLDYDLIAKNPKILVGYSDITALHLAIQKMTGLVTFHGPVLLSQFTPFTQECFRRALFSKDPLGALSNPRANNPLRPEHKLRTIKAGVAHGRLIGGNLTLISALMGTPYEIDTAGAILFTEDVDEEPYRIDRMLTQLRLANKLQAASGIVFGECVDCGPKDYKPSSAWNLTLGEVLDDRLSCAKGPILSGLTVGHSDDQLTLPLGIQATLDTERGQLIIEESATV